MARASLRLKFTPFMQNIYEDNTKCCLEIMPEVSCLENLDRIKWKPENSFIEYTIPMTYKIILKKINVLKEKVNDLDKTYHSCVDLLLPSSLTDLNLGRGDRKKINSDTYIPSKVTANYDYIKLLSNSTLGSLATGNIVIKKAISSNDNNVCNVSELRHIEDNIIKETRDDNDVKGEDDLATNFRALENVYNTGFSVNDSLDKITNTDSIFRIYKTVDTQSMETFTNIYNSRSTSKDGSKRRLSLTPICAINTNGYIENIDKNINNSTMCSIFHAQKALAPVVNKASGDSKSSKIVYSDEVYKMYAVQCKEENEKDLQTVHCKHKTRVLPEIRVARIVKAMKKEILPLQATLNHIVHKYLLLDITVINKSPKKCLMYKTVPDCSNEENKSKAKQQKLKSNRVVYSIVFDD